MNITFLIGNGFDINLGLSTTYSNFINYYKTLDCSTEILKKFRSHIRDNEELWKNAEIALGKYTSDFDEGKGMDFSKCHQNFCENLVEYLREEQKRFAYQKHGDKIIDTFVSLNQLTAPFPTEEKNILASLYKKFQNEAITFNFICFNYTSTLDACLSTVKSKPSALGQHKYGNSILNHSIGKISHVHGTLDKDMIFAVNDETQIAKPEIFNFEDGDIDKNFLIKQKANISYLENTDTLTNQILQNSTIIYIYGMSLGETDKLWWERINNWLRASTDRHLIIYDFNMPPKGVYSLPYQKAERKKKNEILAYSSFDKSTKTLLYQRIHITGENIFKGIAGIAEPVEKHIDTIEATIDEEKRKAV
ncbi:MAG: hypothetical protein E7348_06595 [Clostridiales bacterium]|nr:hypothetical protein [Clostridiales bacterium]